MEALRIDLCSCNTADARAECQRLGIEIGPRSRLPALQAKLRHYNKLYNLWQKYCRLAVMLYGENHGIDTRTHETIKSDISDRLFQRLHGEGYVDPFNHAKPLHDPRNGQTIHVLERQGGQHLRTIVAEPGKTDTSGSCDILFAARLAFPDFAALHAKWEAEEGK